MVSVSHLQIQSHPALMLDFCARLGLCSSAATSSLGSIISNISHNRSILGPDVQINSHLWSFLSFKGFHLGKDDFQGAVSRFSPQQNLHKKQQKLHDSMVLSEDNCLKKEKKRQPFMQPSHRADHDLLGFVLRLHQPLVVGVPQDEAPVDDG